MRSLMLLLANIEIVLAEIVLPPSNTAVIKGEEMQMTCLTNNNSKVRRWDIFTTKQKPLTLYSAERFHKNFSHFGVEVDDNGSGILYTNSTTLSDAGIYKCLSLINNQDIKELSAQLIVLDSIPTCEESFTSNSLLDGDLIWMQCNVNFRGFWTPTMEWIEYNGGQIGPEGRRVRPTEGIGLTRIQNASVTSNISFVVNSSTDGSRFACKLYFAKYDGTYNMTATNVPNFTYTWTSSLITLSYSSSESDFTTLETMEATTAIRRPTTRENLENKSSTDWYYISLSLVAALSVFLIIIVVLVVAFCIRFKKKLSAKYASAALMKLEMSTNDGNYDILPYATSDNYDTIDDTIIVNDDFKVSFAPRQGPLPTPGYSSLTETNAIAPGVYSRIDTYETPVDITPISIDTKVMVTLENTSEERRGESEIPVQPYLELLDAANPGTIHKKHFENNEQMVNGKGEMDLLQEGNQSPVHPYIELLETVVVADKPEEYNRTTDCDIPSTYLTVNF